MKQAKTIKEQIGFLIELQIIDREIFSLKKEKKEKPEKVETIERALEGKKTGIEQAEENLKVVQVKLKNREGDLQQKEQQIEKLQTQLYQLKSNKEYSAMLSEIEGLKADNSLIEEEIIKLMDEIELAKKRMKEEKELFQKESLDAQKEKDVVNVRLKEIESRFSELSLERDKIVPDIEKQILAGYERVLENREGIAIVSVEDSACGGCHMSLPAQVVNEAKLKENIVICNSCSRILYVDDNVEVN